MSNRRLERQRRLQRQCPFPVVLPCCLGACLLIAIALPTSSTAAEVLLLKGATVHTVSGEVHSPGDVLIRDGQINEVAETITPDNASIVDLTGLHLYPGLIATDTSLGLLEISAVRATRDTTEVGSYTPDVRSWLAVNPDSELIPVARANGITHIQPVPSGGIVSGLSGVLKLHGWTTEEMTVHKPVALHLSWPSMNLDTRPKAAFDTPSRWKSLADQDKDRRGQLEALDRFFSDARDYANSRKANRTAVVPAWDAMLPWVEGDIPLVIRANELRQIEAAVRWSTTNGFRMILAGGRDAWKVADLLATNHIPVLFEHVFTQPADDADAYNVHFQAPGVLHRAGVQLVLSEGPEGDAATNLRNLPYSAAQAVAHGLPESEALKAITLHPADVLGMAARLGSIAAGKEATLIATDGELFDIRSNVKRMWIAGEEIALDSRHTRLYRKYRERPARPR